MHTIKINDDTYYLPQAWDELTPKQLQFLIRQSQTDVPVEQLKIYMMLYCLGAKISRRSPVWDGKKDFSMKIGKREEYTRFRIGRRHYDLLPEEVSALADLFGFLFAHEADRYGNREDLYYIKPDLFKNPYYRLRIRLHRFCGPDNGLYDITFEQYMYLQTYLNAMQDDPQMLDSAIACLWYSGKQFDINRVEHDAKLLHHLPHTTRMILYWFISSSLRNFGEMFPRLFSGQPRTVKNNVFDMQLRLLDSLANSDMTKKDAIRKGALLDALYCMDESMRKQEEMEERLKNK